MFGISIICVNITHNMHVLGGGCNANIYLVPTSIHCVECEQDAQKVMNAMVQKYAYNAIVCIKYED